MLVGMAGWKIRAGLLSARRRSRRPVGCWCFGLAWGPSWRFSVNGKQLGGRTLRPWRVGFRCGFWVISTKNQFSNEPGSLNTQVLTHAFAGDGVFVLEVWKR